MRNQKHYSPLLIFEGTASYINVEEFSIGKNGEVVNKMFFSDLML
jgi:hypothetical protein